MKPLRAILYLLLLEPLVSSGRIGRIKFLLLYLWGYWPFLLLAALADESHSDKPQYALSTAVAAAFFYLLATTLGTGIRRLHDLGWSGFWVLLVGVIWPLLLLLPGQPHANRYGAPAVKNSATSQVLGGA